MSDSYFRRAREVAQLETCNAELQIKCLAMAKFLYTHKAADHEAAMRAAYVVLGIAKPQQLKFGVAA